LLFLLLKSHPEHNAENIPEFLGDDVPEDNVSDIPAHDPDESGVQQTEFAYKEPEPTTCRSTRSTAGKQEDPNREPCPAARMNSVAASQ